MREKGLVRRFALLGLRYLMSQIVYELKICYWEKRNPRCLTLDRIFGLLTFTAFPNIIEFNYFLGILITLI